MQQPLPETAVLRVPCPHCRESLDPGASVCPHCRRSALYQLRARTPVADPRVRYAVARKLAQLTRGAPLSRLLSALEAGAPLLSGVTLDACNGARGVLSSSGLEGVLEPLLEPPARHPSRRSTLLLAALGISAGVSVALVSYRSGQQPVVVQPASAEPAGASLTPAQVAARSLGSVVQLRCQNKSGSGFFISPRRLLTNEHVTCGAQEPIEIETSQGQKGKARVVDASRHLDAALLEVADLTGDPLPLASAGPLVSGDALMVIGSPLGLDSTFHVGNVSNPRRVMLDLCYLQLDARINPGNSGGPALDAAGRVVGIVSMKRSDGEGIGLALPIDYLYEGEARLLDPPASHPHSGFVQMLQRAEQESQRLEREKAQLGVRLLDARPVLGDRFFAVVTTLSERPPRPWLQFRLEGEGQSCSADADVNWQVSAPTEGYAARIRDWMDKKGLGHVYFGQVQVEFQGCPQPVRGPLALVLKDGDESQNRVVFE